MHDIDKLPVGKHHLGEGLYIQVTQGARKGPGSIMEATKNYSWLYRYWDGARERWHGLGRFPAVSVAEARKRQKHAAHQVFLGIDPIDARRERRRQAQIEKQTRKTFAEAAKEYHALHADGWRSSKHAQQWLAALQNHVFPRMGATPISEVTHEQVVRTFEPSWKQLKSAPVVLGAVVRVLDWAVARGYRSREKPILKDQVALALGSRGIKKVEHFAALHYEALPALVAELVAMRADSTLFYKVPRSLLSIFLRLVIATAVRSNELFGATWGEFDTRKKIWTVPAARMKGNREHKVPLNAKALQALDDLVECSTSTLPQAKLFAGIIAPHEATRTKGASVPLALLQQLRAGITVHGFRSSFCDWAAEIAHMSDDVAKACLAHRVQDAYKRTQLLERRRLLMEKWSDYLTDPGAFALGGEVILFPGQAARELKKVPPDEART